MARSWSGSTNRIDATIPALDSTDWTMFAWFKTSDSSSFEKGLFNTNSSGVVDQGIVITSTADRILRVYQRFTDLDYSYCQTGSGAYASDTWTLFFGVFTGSTKDCSVYLGTIATPVAETSTPTDVAASGTTRSNGTALTIGGYHGSSQVYTGHVGLCGAIPRKLSLGEMEAIRLGSIPIEPMKALYLLDSPTAGTITDYSGNGAHGTVGATAPTVVEDPPVPYSWSDAAEAATVNPNLTVSLGQAVENDTPQVLGKTKTKEIAQATETDTASSLGKGFILGRVNEADLAGEIFSRGFNTAYETDTAQPIAVRLARLAGQAAESDLAQIFRPARGDALEQIVELDRPSILRPLKRNGQVNSIWLVMDGDGLASIFEQAIARSAPTTLKATDEVHVVHADEVVLQVQDDTQVVLQKAD